MTGTNLQRPPLQVLAPHIPGVTKIQKIQNAGSTERNQNWPWSRQWQLLHGSLFVHTWDQSGEETHQEFHLERVKGGEYSCNTHLSSGDAKMRVTRGKPNLRSRF